MAFTMESPAVALALAVLFFLAQWRASLGMVLSKETHQVYWNSSNPIFDKSNTHHVIYVRRGDMLNIICPFRDSQSQVNDDTDYHALNMVNYDQYKYCSLNRMREPPRYPKWFFACNEPTAHRFYSFLITNYSPQPQGFEFLPGREYYIISTSNGSVKGQNQTEGGVCETMNMKLRLIVQPDRTAEDTTTTTTTSTTTTTTTEHPNVIPEYGAIGASSGAESNFISGQSPNYGVDIVLNVDPDDNSIPMLGGDGGSSSSKRETTHRYIVNVLKAQKLVNENNAAAGKRFWCVTLQMALPLLHLVIMRMVLR